MRIRTLMLAGCLCWMGLLSGCSSTPYYSESQESLNELCRQAGVDFFYDPVVRSVTLSRSGRSAVLVIDSRAVVVEGQEFLLNEPVKVSGSQVYVSADFRDRVLCRLDANLCQGAAADHRWRVMIDPGHGGKDPGATGAHGIQEKEVALDISRRLAQQLERDGYEVRMTRRTDEFLSLEERTEQAARWKADVYISIHANASESRQVSGFEVWAPRQLTREDFAETQRRKNHQIFFQGMKMASGRSALERTLEDLLYRYKQAESSQLADKISRRWRRDLSPYNRGIKESGFFVLRNTLIPSVLVEVGFITNAAEARRFKDASYRQEIAGMLAQGILEYIREL